MEAHGSKGSVNSKDAAYTCHMTVIVVAPNGLRVSLPALPVCNSSAIHSLFQQIFIFKNFIDVQLIYNVLVLGVQHSDSNIYMYVLFQILFHYRLL